MWRLILIFIATAFFISFSKEKTTETHEHWHCEFHDEIHENTAICEEDFYSKKDYPQDYFQSPVKHTIRLAGTFGELRPNHFHSGIDIKSSSGGSGDPLYAIADGHVVRIKSTPGGFGKALYIRHPNGYTSVYAHMNQFSEALEKYVKRNQYARKSFSVDLYPEAGQFKFKQGEMIGKMGNTGSSQGPHLHFEIRDAATEKPVNPLLFGFKMADSRAPKMHQVKIYHLNDKRETIGSKVYNLTKKGSEYRISGDTLTIGAWRAGFGLKVYDHHDNVNNWNGIYSLEMLKDDVPFFDFDMETFSFGETRYINAHLDYSERVTNKAYFNRCYQLPGNRLSIYNKKENSGIMPLHQGKPTKITMLAKDADGNTSKLQFWVKRGEVKPAKSASFNYKIPYNETKSMNLGDLSLYFPKGVFYENLYLKYDVNDAPGSSFYAPIHKIHNYKTPVHKYFDIALRPNVEIPANLKNKAFIAYIGKSGKVSNCGGTWKNGKLHAKVRALGKYTIKVDDVAPKITPSSFSSNMKSYNKMTFKITDNYEAGGKARGLKYSATVDGKWILMEYDSKNDLLIHRFDEKIGAGKHQLKLTVTDNRGNAKVLEREFLR